MSTQYRLVRESMPKHFFLQKLETDQKQAVKGIQEFEVQERKSVQGFLKYFLQLKVKLGP